MQNNFKYAPSILGCKPWNLLPYVKEFEKSDIDQIHCDIMDGNFVPNIAVGFNEIKSLHEATNIPLDLHLMVEKPESVINYFDINEGDFVSFHPETCNGPYRLIQNIKSLGACAGIALSPATPITYIEELKEILDFVLVMSVEPGFGGQKIIPEAIGKISRIREKFPKLEIMVDGDCSAKNAKLIKKAGASGCAIGSSLIDNNPDCFQETFKEYKEELWSE